VGGALDTVTEKLLLLMILACPVMMGVMMLLMWRGMRGHNQPDDSRSRHHASPREVTDSRGGRQQR
jgi:hypothetical protein